MQQGNALGHRPASRDLHPRDGHERPQRCAICTIGLGGKMNGVPREDHFMITVASEIMAILCLAYRLGRPEEAASVDILVALHLRQASRSSRATCKCGGRDGRAAEGRASSPTWCRRSKHTPCLMHGGPFANIAHGCNQRAARPSSPSSSRIIAITEAGFGADLGAEKFLDIKCRKAGLKPELQSCSSRPCARSSTTAACPRPS